MLPKKFRYPVIGFQVRRNSTVRGSKPGPSLPPSFGHDFVSRTDKSSPYFSAFFVSALKVLSASAFLGD